MTEWPLPGAKNKFSALVNAALAGEPTEVRPESNLTVARDLIDLPLQGLRYGHDVMRNFGGLRARSRTATP